MFTLKARPCDELIIRSTERATSCAKRQQNWVLAACVLGSSMAFIDSSVVNVALPKMESELGATLSAMTWVINSYTLCMSALLLIGGALADQAGRRRIFITGLSIFAAASVSCGLAPDVNILVLARAVQGVGAALLIPCSLAIIGAVFDEEERGAAIGVWSGASAVAAGGCRSGAERIRHARHACRHARIEPEDLSRTRCGFIRGNDQAGAADCVRPRVRECWVGCPDHQNYSSSTDGRSANLTCASSRTGHGLLRAGFGHKSNLSRRASCAKSQMRTSGACVGKLVSSNLKAQVVRSISTIRTSRR